MAEQSSFTRLTWQLPSSPNIPMPAERYVASLDLLGFKQALKSHGIGKMSEAYSKALRYSQAIKTAQKTTFEALIPAAYCEDEGQPGSADMWVTQQPVDSRAAYSNITQHAVFSDSLFLFSKDNSDASRCDIIELSNAIFQIFLSWKLPLCGGIAHGECIVLPEQQIFLGDAIIKAFELQSKVDIVGVVCHSDVPHENRLSEPVSIALKRRCCEGQSYEHLRIPLPLSAHLKDMWEVEPDLVSCFQELAISAPERARSKYENGASVFETMTGLNLNGCITNLGRSI